MGKSNCKFYLVRGLLNLLWRYMSLESKWSRTRWLTVYWICL